MTKPVIQCSVAPADMAITIDQNGIVRIDIGEAVVVLWAANAEALGDFLAATEKLWKP